MLPPLVARPPADPTEERRIRRLAHARHAPASWLQRARIITLSWDGAQVGQIAAQLGCHPRTVYRWLHRFNTGGIDALGDRPRSGRPRGCQRWTAATSSRWPAATRRAGCAASPTARSAWTGSSWPTSRPSGPLTPWPPPPGPKASPWAAARSAGSCRPKGCVGVRCAPGAPAATPSSPPKGRDHRPLHQPAGRGDRGVRR